LFERKLPDDFPLAIPAFSPDGSLLAVGGGKGHLLLFDVSALLTAGAETAPAEGSDTPSEPKDGN
jgi:hypothetical protein